MKLIVITSVALSICSTMIMSYISMATPIGPWIAPTVILCALLIYAWCLRANRLQDALVYTTLSASVGGILATACGFTFPTLYFLDAASFNQLLARPFYFCLLCSVCTGTAGWYGIWLARCMQPVIFSGHLPFPIAHLMYKMIVVQQELSKAYELAVGFVATTLFCIAQDGLCRLPSVLPKTVVVCSKMQYGFLNLPPLHLDLWPMLWAIGFVTGHLIVMPLLIGSVSALFLIRPLQELFFPMMSCMDFMLAFCSGMVVSGALLACIPKKRTRWRAMINAPFYNIVQLVERMSGCNRLLMYEGLFMLTCIVILLWYVGFTFFMQGYLLIGVAICTYQIVIIAGKIGLAQLGRFATFVLVPALFIFRLDALQIMVIALFVEVSAGVAVDVLCGRKMAMLTDVDMRRVTYFQYGGLIVSCSVIGIIFWLLITNLGLGSPELFAQRAQARALLVHAQQFDFVVLVLGALYGFVLKYVHVNPMLVLGGILMPLNLSLGLVLGGLAAYASRNAERWFALWSGVFAANSLWMVIKGVM